MPTLTLKEQLVERMRALGIEPKRSLGQNFLIDDFVVNQIIAAVDHVGASQIIEVGPGLGALTERLIKKNISHILIELDRKFAEYWRERGEIVIEDDALKLDWAKLNLAKRVLLVGNLPYQISSRLVMDRSFEPAEIETMIFMFQKEVAERLIAKPSTSDYGLLSVIAQSHWRISTVVEASPESFYPIPRVASRVLQFDRKSNPQFGRAFLSFVKESFQFRRKLLTKNLKKYGSAVKSELTRMGLRETARPEELSVEQFQELYLALSPQLSSAQNSRPK